MVKQSMLNLLRRIRPLLQKICLLSLSCLWSVSICLLLFSRPAIAQNIKFDFDTSTPPKCVEPDLHRFKVNEGGSINELISLTDPPAIVKWEFGEKPKPQGAYPSCTDTRASHICNGVNITIPADPVLGSETASVESMKATAPGFYTFDLKVEDNDDSTVNCTRRYALSIVKPDLPFDIGFVLDRSGSMRSNADPDTPGTSRWQVLQNSVTHFVSDLIELNEKHTSRTSNQFGLTLFASDVENHKSFPDGPSDPSNSSNRSNPSQLNKISDFPLPPEDPAVSDPDSLPGEITTELGNQTPSGSTAMGLGLQSALEQWSPILPVPLDMSKSRVVVLFSDGEQNQSPEIDLNGRAFSGGAIEGQAINTYPSPTEVAGEGSVQIITIGIGSPDEDYEATLQNLAAQNRGIYISTADGEDFDFNSGDLAEGISWDGSINTAFMSAIAPALKQNSPLMVASYQGTVPSYQTVPTIEAVDTTTPPAVSDSFQLSEFDIDFDLKKLLIDFSFNRELSTYELTELLEKIHIYKDGTDVTQYFRLRSQPGNGSSYDYYDGYDYYDPYYTTTWMSLVTDFSIQDGDEIISQIPSEGSYLVQIDPVYSQDLSFQTFVIADDAHLEADWGITPTLPRVGEPVDVSTGLQWRGQALQDATVKAYILEPGTYIGHLLATNPLIVDLDLNNPDTGSPGYQKYLSLLENDPDFVEQLAYGPQELELVDQGNGTYLGSYTPSVPGTAQIFIQVRGKDPELNTEIQRLLFLSSHNKPAPIDLANSSIVTQSDGDRTTINWRPKTVDGYFFGPANAAAIKIQAADGSVPENTRIVDNQDGSYTITIDAIAPDANIGISVLDEEIYQGPLKQFGFIPELHTIEALNDAYGDGTFTQDEVGEPGGQVLFQVTITNSGPNDITINAIEDSLFGPQLANLVGTTIAAGASVTDTFSGTLFESPTSVLEGTESSETLIGAEALQINTVSVSFTDANGSTATVSGDSTVRIPAKDTIAGGLGDDRIFGKGADDVLRGDLNQRNPQLGTGGNDFISGGTGDDRIGGKGGNDTLLGDEGDDRIYGDDGDDTLVGGPGNDTLTGDDSSGGQGRDIFVLAAGDDTDTITDFEVGTDLIGLTDNLTFAQLSLDQTGSDTTISLFGKPRLIIQRAKASELNQAAFVPNFSASKP